MRKLKQNKKSNEVIISEFYRIVSILKSKQEVKEFLKALLTQEEQIMLAKRVGVAKLLMQNFGYGEIKKKLKVTNSKIHSVKNNIKESEKGFLKIFRRMDKSKKWK